MTTPRISPAGISGLVGLVHDLRPEWDRRGIAAAVHRLADHIPAAPLALAFIRGAVDPANETPAAVTYLDNRAWTDWWPKCESHPEERRRRTNGQCAACHSDRLEAVGIAAQFHRRPPTAGALQSRARLQGGSCGTSA